MSRELTVKEVSQLLGLSERTVRRYAKNGRLMFKLINGEKGLEYRFDENEIKKYLGHSDRLSGTTGQKAVRLDQLLLFKELQSRYEQALVRLGQLENQRLMLSERAESLQRREAEYQRIIEEKERIIQEKQKIIENLTRKKWWEFWKKPISQLLSGPSQP